MIGIMYFDIRLFITMLRIIWHILRLFVVKHNHACFNSNESMMQSRQDNSNDVGYVLQVMYWLVGYHFLIAD